MSQPPRAIDTETAPSWIAAAPALFVVMWATGFIVARLSAPHVEPLTFLVIRFAIAGVVLALIAAATGARWPGRRSAAHALIAGALLHGGYLGPIYWAIANGMPAGVSALITGLQPLITTLLAARLVGERIAPRHWLGLAIGIAGVALVLSPKLSLSAAQGITPATIAVNFLGTISIAAGTVYQKRHATGIDLASGGAWQYLGGFAVVALGAILTEDFRFDNAFDAWFALAWSVIVLSIGAISILMLLIRHGEVSRVSGLIFLVPGVTAIMAWALFGESLTLIQIFGMVVSAGAVLLVTRRNG